MLYKETVGISVRYCSFSAWQSPSHAPESFAVSLEVSTLLDAGEDICLVSRGYKQQFNCQAAVHLGLNLHFMCGEVAIQEGFNILPNTMYAL